MKIKGQIARQKNTNKFNMSKQTITTTDFGIKRPIMCNVMFPGDKFIINIDHLTRLMPMPNPTFGKIKEIIRAFTIPYRTIHKHFNDVLSNNYIYTNGSKATPETHWMYLGDICNEIYSNGNIVEVGDEDDYDICIEKYIIENTTVDVDERKYLKYTHPQLSLIPDIVMQLACSFCAWTLFRFPFTIATSLAAATELLDLGSSFLSQLTPSSGSM